MSWLMRRSATFLESTWIPRTTPSRFQRYRKRRLQNQNSQPARRASHRRSNGAYALALVQRKVATKRSGARAAKKTASPSRVKSSVTSIASTRGASRVATSEPSRLRVTGAWIVRLRRKHNLSVAEFARQLGVSTSTRLSLGTHVRKPQPAKPGPRGFCKPSTNGLHSGLHAFRESRRTGHCFGVAASSRAALWTAEGGAAPDIAAASERKVRLVPTSDASTASPTSRAGLTWFALCCRCLNAQGLRNGP